MNEKRPTDAQPSVANDWSTASPGKARAVVVGASAGGVQALLAVLAPLPSSFRLPILVVLHLPADRISQLSELFGERLHMAVRDAGDKEAINPGTVYFACPGYHLSVERDCTFSLSCEPPLNYSRPSIDILMESAADVYGEGLVGVLLTGANADGAEGLRVVKQRGGLTVVQDPAEAQAPAMPTAAIWTSPPDFILDLCGIQSLLLKLEKLSP
ncbi:MAG: CheB methylesterase [Polaromonas sp.]|nr:CheB methylesterase [Polaromonas sp.]